MMKKRRRQQHNHHFINKNIDGNDDNSNIIVDVWIQVLFDSQFTYNDQHIYEQQTNARIGHFIYLPFEIEHELNV